MTAFNKEDFKKRDRVECSKTDVCKHALNQPSIAINGIIINKPTPYICSANFFMLSAKDKVKLLIKVWPYSPRKRKLIPED